MNPSDHSIMSICHTAEIYQLLKTHHSPALQGLKTPLSTTALGQTYSLYGEFKAVS